MQALTFIRLRRTPSVVTLLAYAMTASWLCTGCVNTSFPVGPTHAPVSVERTQATTGGARPASAPGQIYLLQPGDSFDVKFFYSQELNESAVIRPDGRISLQLVGEIQAAGLETGELERELRARYGRILRDPSVTVIVRQTQPQRVFVAGEVRSPGEVVLQPDMTALQAVSRAGFFTRDAETRNVVVLRYKGAEGPEFIVLNLKALMDGQTNGPRDVALLPMDIVFVPQTEIAGLADFFNRYVNSIVPLWRNVGFSMIYYTNAARLITP
jgi:protein involved in polysaccharide export with SLBB domain